MRKNLFSLAIIALLGCSIEVQAADVGTDMDILAGNYGKILRTDNKADFIAGLAKMKAAAIDAKKSKPQKFNSKPDNSPEIIGYRQGMDKLIGQIDKASELAIADKMPAAKAEVQSFKTTRNENHKKYR